MVRSTRMTTHATLVELEGGRLSTRVASKHAMRSAAYDTRHPHFTGAVGPEAAWN